MTSRNLTRPLKRLEASLGSDTANGMTVQVFASAPRELIYEFETPWKDAHRRGGRTGILQSWPSRPIAWTDDDSEPVGLQETPS